MTPYDGRTIYTFEALELIANTSGQAGLDACLLPVETAVSTFPGIKLSTSAAYYLRMGQAVRATLPLKTPLVRLFSEDERFLGIGEVTEDGRVQPYRLLSTQQADACAAAS